LSPASLAEAGARFCRAAGKVAEADVASGG
jgi:hypothetical protein